MTAWPGARPGTSARRRSGRRSPRSSNFQHRQPMSRHWGGGTLSSSDGQRFPVSGKVRNATALPRYFGYGKGVTFYTWTSDQFSQYGTKVIPATVRDATYVLDEILDNETELTILEHTTDTAGYTELVFALFDLLGLQFSPADPRPGRPAALSARPGATYPNLGPRLKGRIRRDRILEPLGRPAAGRRVAEAGLGDRLAADRQAPVVPPPERPDPGPAGVRPAGQDDLHPALPGERAAPAADQHPAQQGGVACTPCGSSCSSPTGARSGGSRRRSRCTRRACLNLLTNCVIAWNTVYMAAAIDRPPHRRAPGPGGRPGPPVTVPLRAHQPVRQVRLRGERGPRRCRASPAPSGPASGLGTGHK